MYMVGCIEQTVQIIDIFLRKSGMKRYLILDGKLGAGNLY